MKLAPHPDARNCASEFMSVALGLEVPPAFSQTTFAHVALLSEPEKMTWIDLSGGRGLGPGGLANGS